MKKERKEDSFLKKPWYKGGNELMGKTISSLMKYPQDAIDNKIEGTVRIKIDIDHVGNVVEAKVQIGIGFGCDEEALRLVKLLKFEVAKTPRKLKVIFHKNLNINFKLKDIKKQASKPVAQISPPTAFSYNVVPSKVVVDQKTVEVLKPKTITYTIKLN